MRANAADLAERVSRLLDHLGVTATVTSGFRTTLSNSKASGSKNSAHLTGQAVDLEDSKRALANAINRDISVLDTFDLFMENTYYSPGWVHLSTRGPPSGRRVFVP